MPTPLLPAPSPVPDLSLHHALPVVMVHRALRREVRLAGPLVRRCEVGDTRRAGVVAPHVEVLLRGLHHHHELEDDLVWPLLRSRTDIDDHPVLDVMEAQHREVDRLVRSTTRLLPVWRTQAAAGARNRLAAGLGALHEVLDAHLDLEELVVLPLAEQHLTAAEWRHIGEEAERRQDRRDRTLAFGMLQHEGDPAVLASMLATAPLPARLLVPRLARRAYRRHATAVHGTPTP